MALAVRLGAAFWWERRASEDGTLFRFGDSLSYWTLAESLVTGEPYQYGGEEAKIFRAPGYPIFLSIVAWIEPEKNAVTLARCWGALWGCVVVGLVMESARRLGGTTAALFAGVAATFYPGAIGMSVLILSEACFVPMMIAGLLIYSSSCEEMPSKLPTRIRIGAPILVGILAAAGTLSRPSWLLFFPFLGAISFVFSRKKRAVFERFLIIGCAMAVVMAPWWWRNWQVTGQFVPTTLQVGASLYDGLHPGASGGSDEGMVFVNRFHQEQLEDDRNSPVPLNSTLEYRLDRRMRDAAMDWVLENPSDALRLAALKFWRTWNPWPPARELGSVWIRLAESVGCFAILLIGVCGLWIARKEGERVWVWFVPVIYFTLLHMVFVGSVRYRQPAIVAVAVLAGVGCSWMLQRYFSRSDEGR